MPYTCEHFSMFFNFFIAIFTKQVLSSFHGGLIFDVPFVWIQRNPTIQHCRCEDMLGFAHVLVILGLLMPLKVIRSAQF